MTEVRSSDDDGLCSPTIDVSRSRQVPGLSTNNDVRDVPSKSCDDDGPRERLTLNQSCVISVLGSVEEVATDFRLSGRVDHHPHNADGLTNKGMESLIA